MINCTDTPRVPSRYNLLVSPQWYAGGTPCISGAIAVVQIMEPADIVNYSDRTERPTDDQRQLAWLLYETICTYPKARSTLRALQALMEVHDAPLRGSHGFLVRRRCADAFAHSLCVSECFGLRNTTTEANLGYGGLNFLLCAIAHQINVGEQVSDCNDISIHLDDYLWGANKPSPISTAVIDDYWATPKPLTRGDPNRRDFILIDTSQYADEKQMMNHLRLLLPAVYQRLRRERTEWFEAEAKAEDDQEEAAVEWTDPADSAQDAWDGGDNPSMPSLDRWNRDPGNRYSKAWYERMRKKIPRKRAMQQERFARALRYWWTEQTTGTTAHAQSWAQSKSVPDGDDIETPGSGAIQKDIDAIKGYFPDLGLSGKIDPL